jgi:hypothetical protein
MDGQLRLRWRCAQAVSSDLTIQGHKKRVPLVRVSWVMDMGYRRPGSWALGKFSFVVGTTAPGYRSSRAYNTSNCSEILLFVYKYKMF